MDVDDDGKILTVFRVESIENLLLFDYNQMMPLLHFLDKYARKVVNGDEMKNEKPRTWTR